MFHGWNLIGLMGVPNPHLIQLNWRVIWNMRSIVH
jgi:hypothetical protein